MADLFSFDVVSKVEMQEVKNVIDQSLKEITQRFDFKGTKTEVTLKEKEMELVIVSDDEYKLKSVVDIVRGKLTKRNVSVRAFTFGAVEPSLGGWPARSPKSRAGWLWKKPRRSPRRPRTGS